MPLSASILSPPKMEAPVHEPVPKTGLDTGGEFRFVMDEGDAKKVRQLLEQGASANCKADHDMYRPLHYALVKRRPDFVKPLLEHGAAPNSRDENGRLPLLLASRLGLSGCVRMLLQAGARVFQPLNERRWSALHVSAHCGHEPCVEAILELAPELLNVTSCRQTLDTPLHLATRSGHLGVVAQLLAAGAAVDPKNKPLGHTPLHDAATLGHTEITELLLDYGADAELPEAGSTKRSALALARDYKHNDCITVLLAATQDITEFAQASLRRLHQEGIERERERVRRLAERDLRSRARSRGFGASRGSSGGASQGSSQTGASQ